MIINQPYANTLGKILISQLLNENYKEFNFIVAYAKLSGVNRLIPYLTHFKMNGGIINGVVGVDQQGTSKEALLSLYNICDNLKVFHSESYAQTFHPKIYIFHSEDELWYAIGSNNMTAGGLFSNYEISTITSSTPTSLDAITILKAFNDYSNPSSKCCLPINADLIDELANQGYIKNENQLNHERKIKQREEKSAREKPLFGFEVFKAPALTNEVTPSPNEEVIVNTNDDNIFLIRHIPSAGDRSQQVHFTLDILENYFKLEIGDPITVQAVYASADPSVIEDRKIIFSNSNKNVKVELRAAEFLNDNYPDDITRRPILVMRKLSSTMFIYTILMHGDSGYNEINNRLMSLPPRRSLAYEILDETSLLGIWNDCYLV